MSLPLPVGFGIELDPDAKELRPGLWYGGQPARVLRLTGPGAGAWARLRCGGVTDRTTGRLARRLTDAGLAHPVPPPVSDPGITVVIPVRDRAAALDRCLDALGTQHPVVVVDDASADVAGVAAVAQRHGARLLRLERNLGPAGARNAGLAQVHTELVAFLDSDTVPTPGWANALAAHLADPLVAAAAPRMTPLAGDSWTGRYARATSSLDLGPRPARVAAYTRVSYVPTAALVARRDALFAVARAGDVFEPTMRTGEDVDLVWRLVERGHRVRYQPDVTVAHEEPASLRALLARRRSYGRAAAPLAQRHPDALAPLVVDPWFAAGAAGLALGRPLVAVAGYAGAVAQVRRTLTRAGVPTDGTLRAVADGVRQTYLGTARVAVQFAAPLLAVGIARRSRTAMATSTATATAFALAPSIAAWWPHRRELDPVRFTVAHLADEIAYGSGVLASCVQHRTARPLLPRIVRRTP